MPTGAAADKVTQPIAGLVPVMRVAQDAGLYELVAGSVCLPGSVGSNPARKVATKDAVTARLIVRRVRRLAAADGQGELFPAWRYHAVFTDSRYVLAQAEAQHRGHAVIEQVLADLIDGPLAHPPSGKINANGAWLALAGIAHNLTRAAGCLTSFAMAKARSATIRRKVVNVAARIVRHARTVTLRLPEHWPWQHEWQTLFTNTHAPPG